MSTSGAKWVLDADATRAVGATKQVEGGMKKAAGAAADIGKEVSKVGQRLGNTIAGVTVLVGAIRAAAAAFKAMNDEAANASKQVGQHRVDAGIAGARLGLNAGDVSALTAGGREDVGGFLGSLVNVKSPTGAALDRSTVFRAANLFRGGGFAQDEITKALSDGTFGRLERSAGGRRAALGEDVMGELDLRDYERQQAAAAAQASAGRGATVRRGQAAMGRLRAQSPWAATGTDIVNGASLGLVTPLLERIADNTSPRPALARPPE